MSEKFESKFGQIDDLLNEVEQSISGKRLLAEIDDLCGEIDTGLEARKNEVKEWPDERKRKEAVNSEDQFVLNLLSMDENFNIRTLSACNPNTPANSLRRLAEGANDYVKMVIANNPNSSSDILDRIAELSGEQEVLDAVRSNGNVSTVTKYKIENRM
jgi:hypothetical protein